MINKAVTSNDQRGKTMSTPGKERQRLWKERQIADGKKFITVTVSRKAQDILKREKARSGETLSQIVERAILNFEKEEA